jgi:glycosyltransferase involved in cell wall biosynthesis
MLRVLALVPYPLGRVPGQRYRIEQWAPGLAAEGIELRFAPFLSPRGLRVLYEPGHLATKAWETAAGHWRRRALTARLHDVDLVYVYREACLLGPPWAEARAARRRPVVFDFDDAIYLPNASEANAWASRLKPRDKAERTCRLSRRVMAGNETLAGWARERGADATVVPSTIDTAAYEPRPRPAGPRPVVGWTGSATTVPHLALLAGALQRLRCELDFELRVIGGSLAVPGVDVRCLPWRAETEAEDVSAFDVGVMPLPDDEWSRGKCGMKALQYMGLAIPPVVSPVGANATIVTDGADGFHARSDDEWVERLARLLRDQALRRALGAAARRTVEARFSAAVQAPRVARVFREAAG